jgi:membrane protein DedA with SNARE-associated domain
MCDPKAAFFLLFFAFTIGCRFFVFAVYAYVGCRYLRPAEEQDPKTKWLGIAHVISSLMMLQWWWWWWWWWRRRRRRRQEQKNTME